LRTFKSLSLNMLSAPPEYAVDRDNLGQIDNNKLQRSPSDHSFQRKTVNMMGGVKAK
jgi:hypothetical protein